MLGFDDTRLTWLHGDRFAFELCHFFTIGIKHLCAERKSTCFRILVLHLRLCVNHSLMVRDVEVGSIDIRARRAEVGIEGQCLVELIRDMQEYVLGDATVVGVEVTVVPLVTTVVLA